MISESEVERARHWDEAFRTRDRQDVSWYQAVPATSLALIAAAPQGIDARVIDVGGGANGVVAHLLERGYTRVGVLDISSTALGLAREKLAHRASHVQWFVADVTSFESPHPWDVWHDRAVFHFLTEQADRDAYRRVVLASVPVGGTVVISTFGPEGPERCSGLPTRRYSADELAAELGPELALEEYELEEHRTPAGRIQQFVYCRFTRIR